MKALTRTSIVATAVLAFFLNPGFGCSGEDEFAFDQQDMEDAIVGTWRVKAPDAEVTFSLAPAPAPAKTAGLPWVKSAHACGNRSFFSTAGACVTVSSLLLTGQVGQTGDLVGDGPVEGSFEVYGATLTDGFLQATFARGGRVEASGIDQTGSSFPATFSDKDGRRMAVMLIRVSRS